MRCQYTRFAPRNKVLVPLVPVPLGDRMTLQRTSPVVPHSMPLAGRQF